MSLAAEADFSLSLLREISFNTTTVLSPLSIALALSLVHAGASGNSKEQIRNALCKESSHEDCENHFCLAQKTILDVNDFGVRVNIANRIFVRNGVKINEDYLDEVLTKYNSTAQSLYFNNPILAAKIVNNYVKEETMGEIDRIVSERSFGSHVQALIVNAIFFQGKWENKFYDTKEDDFFVTEYETKQVTFLKEDFKRFPFFEDDDFMALSLPCEWKKCLYTMVLPKERFGLSSALRTLTGERLHKLITPQENALVNVIIPKFKLDALISLPSVLKKLGISDIFKEGKADLSGISGDSLYIGDANQIATIEINEEGGVASAVTGFFGCNETGLVDIDEQMPINFIAEHPFLFLISHKGHILFTGQYYG